MTNFSTSSLYNLATFDVVFVPFVTKSSAIFVVKNTNTGDNVPSGNIREYFSPSFEIKLESTFVALERSFVDPI